MTRAIVVRGKGGPELLRLETVTVAAPGPGQLKLRQAAAGVNFIDTYFRSGLYKAAPAPGLPEGAFIPGQEGVGQVSAVGPDVTEFQVGDRVAYCNATGGYAEERLIPAAAVVKVPANLKDEQVAGMMLRGLTVWYLVRSMHTLKAGETVVFHAAAGGVGLIFCQWARAIGATVIGTVGTAEKAKIAKDAGCTHTILYKQEDWVAKVKEITGGKGVTVVYDGVGKDTWAGSLECLARRGLLCLFGNASGPVPPVDPLLLSAKGSLFMTRPRLGDYIAERADYVRAAGELFDIVGKGAVKIDVGQTYTLDHAAHAHIDLESRKTTGSTILVM
jgi:NADPH2:quinone reductase